MVRILKGYNSKKEIYFFIICIFFLGFFLTACTSKSSLLSDDVPYTEDQNDKFYSSFTEEEINYINFLKDKGGINIGVRQDIDSCDFFATYRGFNCELAHKFGEYLGVDVNIVNYDSYSALFEVDGIIYDSKSSQNLENIIPDIYDKIDLFAHTMVLHEWRYKFHRFIPFLNTNLVIIINETNNDIVNETDFGGKTIATMKATTYETAAFNLEEKYGYKINYLYSDFDSDLVDMIKNGTADFLLYDSDLVLTGIFAQSTLKIGGTIVDLRDNGWTVSKDNKILQDLGIKFFKKIKGDGTFQEIFFQNNGISFDKYNSLIGLEPK